MMEAPGSDTDTKPKPRPTLVAAADLGRGRGRGGRPFYKSAQWSADGTTVITCTSDNTIASYVLPEDLLDDGADADSEPVSGSDTDASSDSETDSETDSDPDSDHDFKAALDRRCLVPQGCLDLPEPTGAIAPAPYFSLTLPWSQAALISCRDLPVQLHALFPDPAAQAAPNCRPAPMASYPLIKPETEAYLAPSALLWHAPGTHFVAGTTNLLALFDVSRTANAPPLLTVPTIPSTRHLRKGNGVGMRGTVSALSGSIDATHGGPGLVAAGTWTRWVGLYDLARSGGVCVATWSVASAGADLAPADGTPTAGIGGGGILQMLWSPCGRYLVINERRSRGLLVYDIRGSGELLCRLTGRPASTNQRLNCDVFQSASAPTDNTNSFEVWAGTQDGTAVVWEDVGTCGGDVDPSWSWTAHASAIGSTVMHQSGSVVATCSGSWSLPEGDTFGLYDQDDPLGGTAVKTSADASLKIWALT